MKAITSITSYIIAYFLIINIAFANVPVVIHDDCETIPENYYPSGQLQGLIGTTKDKPIDNPADNVFHVALDEKPKRNAEVWLTYELNGVQDHTAVSRSINDQIAIGGYLVQQTQGWKKQRERIHPDLLKQGDNVIRFALPKNANYSYEIRNLGLVIEGGNQDEERQIIINQPATATYSEFAYVKGFIAGADSKNASICVEATEVNVNNGEFEILVPSPAKQCQRSWKVNVEFAYPDGDVIHKKIRFRRATETQITSDFLTNQAHSVEQVFSLENSNHISFRGLTLLAPVDALDKETEISITGLRHQDIPALDPGMVNVTEHSHGYRLLPHGTKFQKEVSIQVKYHKNNIPNGYTAEDIRTFYFDEITHHWIPLPFESVDTVNGVIHSRTNHFTDFINGVIQTPESPETNAYTPTSIKDIKAANPSAAINEIQPPSANNMGTANLSYPINIPAGRQGMQPSLGLQYNSGGGNGWLGLGWDLSVPAITIETRWGVPRYDETLETETYSMMGQMLWPVAHRDELAARSAGDKQFYPRVEGAFNKVIRHGTNPTNYYWEVTDKSGTRYFYGGVTDVDDSAVLKDDEGNIGYWALVETRDLNDNFVRYNHAKINDTGVEGGTVMGRNLYCESITYTGHNNTEGRYSVVFTRDRDLGKPSVLTYK